MDITRLPAAPVAYPAQATIRCAPRPGGPGSVSGPDPVQPHAQERRERVLQGELLHRSRALYQSTTSFLDERNLGRARPAGESAISLHQARRAVGLYLGNSVPVAEPAPGRSVDQFV